MSTLVAGARHAPLSRLAKNLRRAARRAAGDPHTLLAVGLTVPTILVHAVDPTPASSGVVALCLLYIAVQTILATASTLGARIGVLARPVPRLALAVLFVTAVVNQTGDASFRPLAGLYIPVVSMAAAYGGREALIIGALAAVGYFGPALLSGEHFDNAVQRGPGPHVGLRAARRRDPLDGLQAREGAPSPPPRDGRRASAQPSGRGGRGGRAGARGARPRGRDARAGHGPPPRQPRLQPRLDLPRRRRASSGSGPSAATTARSRRSTGRPG